jgi:prepilin-type N-terminal cleavage/methylation domain-containing protein
MTNGIGQMARRLQAHKLIVRTREDDGMSVMEVMVAMVILVVGALGVLTMLNTSNKVTTANIARDGALGLAREEIEQSREVAVVSYAALVEPTAVATTLLSRITGAIPGSLTSTVTNVVGSVPKKAAIFNTKRRGVTYDTTFTSCVLDDPADGIGATTGTPCSAQPPGTVAGNTVTNGTGTAAPGLNILGIPITGTGSLVDAVCGLLSSVLAPLVGNTSGLLKGLVGGGADVGNCSSSGSQVAIDRNPNDATAVTTVVHWTSPTPGQVKLRTVISGPRVTS